MIVAELTGTSSGIIFFVTQQARYQNFDNGCAAIAMLGIHDLDEAILLADRILVLNAHPGENQELIEVAVPRPRSAGPLSSAQFSSAEFQSTKRRLEQLIHPPASVEAGTADDVEPHLIRLTLISDNVE